MLLAFYKRKVGLLTLEQNEFVSLLLPQGSMINQYKIEKLLTSNGESCVYQAIFDEKLFWIREFLPQKMVSRNPETLELEATDEMKTMYKYSMAVFEELFKILKNARDLEYIVPVEEIIHKNNTVYIVKNAVDFPNLKSYIEQRNENISWFEAKKFMLPLMNSVAQLHNKSVVHLGISPENLYVTDDGHLLLSGFSTLEARTIDGELDQQLYDGFSSPEQYVSDDWKGGICSDVYSLAAVLYWLLTGKIPQSAEKRLENDELLPAMELNSEIPENVSDAISGAMMLDPSFRNSCVDEFTSNLLESVSGNTTIYDVPVVQNEHTILIDTSEDYEKPRKKLILPKVLIFIVLFALLTMGAAFGVYVAVYDYFFSQNQSEENLQQEEIVLYKVPDFVGHKFSDIISNNKYTQNLKINSVEEYNNDYPEGVVVAQSVNKNTDVPSYSEITLTISKGKKMIPIPNIVGLSLEEAKKKLVQNNINYNMYIVESDDYQPNTVFRTDPTEGTQIALDDAMIVKIYVTPK